MKNNLFENYINSNSLNNVLYNAVILYKEDSLVLRNKIQSYLTEEEKTWKEYYHHCTISLGPCKEINIPYLESKQRLLITHLGKSDKCVAVRVLELGKVKSENNIPHITCLVSKTGKPKDSNFITDWTEFKQPFPLNGIFQEITK